MRKMTDYIVQHIIQVFNTNEPVFLECSDKRQQESFRVMAYQLRNKIKSLENEPDVLTVTKCELMGRLFIKMYKRDLQGKFFKMSSDGELIPAELPKGELMDNGFVYVPDITRMIKLMRQDGKTQEEIDEAVTALQPTPESENISSIP